jgi:uncharacterized protein YdaU (DUF1376 family)
MDTPPYFAFYPADFANDINVEAMSTLQVGAYLLLLCKAWQADPPASLPSDDVVLARLSRVELAVWLEIKAGVLALFRPGTDGRLHNKRLRQEYDKALQLIRTRRRVAGAGAAARWANHASSMLEASGKQCGSNAIQSQTQTKKKDKKTKDTSAATASGAVKPRDELFDAIAEVTGSDVKANASHIAKVKKLLLSAEPPYTPAEVRRFADPAFCERELPWLQGRRPTLGEIEKNIGRVRNPSAGQKPRAGSGGFKTKGEQMDDYLFGQLDGLGE